MAYTITRLSDELVYIRWHTTPQPGDTAEQSFLDDIKQMLGEVQVPQYYISDLRKGRISNVAVLRQLGLLTKHEKWGGGTGFSSNPITGMYAQIYRRFSLKAEERDAMFERPEEAVAFLESLKPGITEGIDWQQVLADEES